MLSARNFARENHRFNIQNPKLATVGFQQAEMAIVGYEEEKMEEIGYDSDVIDPEYEASLYAKIFHRDLLWYQNMDEQSSTMDHQDEMGEQEWVAKKDSEISNGGIERTLVSSVKRSSVPNISRRTFVDEFDDEDVDGDRFPGKDKLPSHRQLAITSNIAGLEESVKKRKRLEKRRDRNRRRFLRTPQSEWSAKFTIAEIQQFLGGTPDDWRISQEDSGRSLFGDRYYGKKSQGTQCRRCREYGHFARECRVKIKPCCFRCGGPHPEFRCKEEYYCLLCFQVGHVSEACGKIYGTKPLTMRCSRCGKIGHRTHACPDNWRQFHRTTTWDTASSSYPLILLSNAEKRSGPFYCYNCGRGGHLGHECRKPTMFGGRLVCFNPTVSVYDTVSSSANDSSFSNRRFPKSASTPLLTKRPKGNGSWRRWMDYDQCSDAGTSSHYQSPGNGYLSKSKAKHLRFHTSPTHIPGSPGRSNFDKLINQRHFPKKARRENESEWKSKAASKADDQQCDGTDGPKNQSRTEFQDRIMQQKHALQDRLNTKRRRRKAKERTEKKKNIGRPTIASTIKEKTRAARDNINYSDKALRPGSTIYSGVKGSSTKGSNEFKKSSTEMAGGKSSSSQPWNVGNSFSWDQNADGNGQSSRSAWFQ